MVISSAGMSLGFRGKVRGSPNDARVPHVLKAREFDRERPRHLGLRSALAGLKSQAQSSAPIETLTLFQNQIVA